MKKNRDHLDNISRIKGTILKTTQNLCKNVTTSSIVTITFRYDY